MLWIDEKILPVNEHLLGHCSLLEVNTHKKFNFLTLLQADDMKSKPASFVHAHGLANQTKIVSKTTKASHQHSPV